MEWYKFADEFVGINTFGQSGPAEELFELYGFTQDKLKATIKNLVG
jgi:transketolase